MLQLCFPPHTALLSLSLSSCAAISTTPHTHLSLNIYAPHHSPPLPFSVFPIFDAVICFVAAVKPPLPTPASTSTQLAQCARLWSPAKRISHSRGVIFSSAADAADVGTHAAQQQARQHVVNTAHMLLITRNQRIFRLLCSRSSQRNKALWQHVANSAHMLPIALSRSRSLCELKSCLLRDAPTHALAG